MIAWFFTFRSTLLLLMRLKRKSVQALAAIAVCCSFGEGLAAEEELELPKWDYSFNLRGVLGYKDNILLSSIQDEKSAFWQTGLDFTLIKFDRSETEFMMFVSADDRRYFSAEEVEKEQLLLSQVRGARLFAKDWKVGGEFLYYYMDQVIDASATETILESLQVKSHSLIASPFISRKLPQKGELLLEVHFERQIFEQPLDDYWEMGPEITFVKEYGNRSEATLSYGYRERSYDTRRQVDLDLFPIPDTSLEFTQHEAEMGLNHSWNESRSVRSRLRFSFERNEDNGSGFFDYNRYRVSKRLSYVKSDWEASVEGKFLLYDYSHQPIPTGEEGERERTEYLLNFRIEKTFWESLTVFVESEHEWSLSNIVLDEYQVNTYSAGIDWEF